MLRRLTKLCLLVAVLGCGSPSNRTEPAADSRARSIHEQILTLDTHLDTPTNLAGDWQILDRHDHATDLSQVDYPRMVAGGLDGGFWAIYTRQGPRTPEGYAHARDSALLTAVRIRELTARHPAQFALATRADDAAEIAARGRRVVYMSIENSYPLTQDLSLLQTFYELGVRMVGVVHTTHNDFADSSTDPGKPEWNGLSERGRSLVAEANRLGMVIDASHASDEVLDQLIALSKTPIILSHSGCKAVFDHPRNVDDERLRKLAAAGGVIQLNTLSDYLIPTPDNPVRKAALRQLWQEFGHSSLDAASRVRLAAAKRALDVRYPTPRASFDDYMKHVLHALEVVGPEHVGIGADWDGGGGVTGLEDVASIPKITERLFQAGYDQAQLQQIWSGNVLRLLRQAEHAKHTAVATP